MKVEFRIVKKVWISLGLALLIVCGLQSTAKAQALEKALITHSSDSVSITPLLYGIEKGFYRKEGIDLQFRVLRGELAESSIVAGNDGDYMYGAGTVLFAAVRGVPMKIVSHGFKGGGFFLMGNARIHSERDFK